MKKVLDEKCLNCGAQIKFNALKNKFICDYCKGEFTLEELNQHKEKVNKEIKLTETHNEKLELEGYNCTNCGASIVSLNNISSTSCLYCKSNAIIKNRLTGIYKPDSIILFKKTKDDAINAFKNIAKGRLLMPKDFNDLKNIQEMEGLYVPFWLYSCLNDAALKADCTKVTTWMDSKYIYTKTSYYKVERSGKLSFISVPNDAAARFDDVIMNAIEPFDYKELQEFNTSYLAGYLSEKYDVSKDDAYKNTKERIENDSVNYLRRELSSYNTVNIKEKVNNINIQDTKYVLLPVWVLNIKYKDKIYHFAMNGQSGKLVGEIPVSISKLLLAIGITFLLSTILILIFFKMLGYRW